VRIVAEFLPKTCQVLIRLLGTLEDEFGNPPTYVLTGSYIIDGTPEFPAIFTFDITSQQVVNNEARVKISGYKTLPDLIKITKPDSSIEVVPLLHSPLPTRDVLAKQPLETVMPDEPAPHNPAHAQNTRVDPAPAEFPRYWFLLDFSRSDPVTLGDDMTSDPIAYVGGGAGRALAFDERQDAEDSFPWLVRSNVTHLEGAWENGLEQSNFWPTAPVLGFVDEIPVGWEIESADAQANIRVRVDTGGLKLPQLEIIYFAPPGDYPTIPPLVILTPPVPANYAFQVLVTQGNGNSFGTIQLTSFNMLVSTPALSMAGTRIARLNVGSHPGRVRIVWQQTPGVSTQQVLTLSAPLYSQYTGPHTWIPYPRASAADVVTVDNIARSTYFSFAGGSIRVASQVEVIERMSSWSITSTNAGENILSLSEGYLTSDYSSSSPVFLSDYLSPLLAHAGNYRINWRAGEMFRVESKITGIPKDGQPIPFELDLAVPISVLDAPIKVEMRSYKPGEGSALINFFSFSPGRF